jgi:hypothetical protein
VFEIIVDGCVIEILTTKKNFNFKRRRGHLSAKFVDVILLFFLVLFLRVFLRERLALVFPSANVSNFFC